jgi:hypothetical protein
MSSEVVTAMALDHEGDASRQDAEPLSKSTYLTHSLAADQDTKKAIVEGLWHIREPPQNALTSERERWAERLENLTEYFEFYRQHFLDLEHLTGRSVSVTQVNKLVIYWKETLAANTTITRERLTAKVNIVLEQSDETRAGRAIVDTSNVGLTTLFNGNNYANDVGNS